MTATLQRVVNYLLVEDNESHIELIMRCLGNKKLSGKSRFVKTGEECLAYLAGDGPYADREQYPYPDVVLLDIRIPGVMDGLQTLRAIRADSRNAALSVMVLTASHNEIDVNRAYKLGANGYIVKSGDTNEFIEKLAQLQNSLETCFELPKQKEERAGGGRPFVEEDLPSSKEIETLLKTDNETALGLLASAYQKDRDEILVLLAAMEQTSESRFADLAYEFCINERERFAGGAEIDWIFIREVIMEKLPRYLEPKKMVRLVTRLIATLENNPVVREDRDAWQYWEGFCQAYLNQDITRPIEMEEEAREIEVVRDISSRNWRGVALGLLTILVILIFLMIGREFF